MPRVLAWLFILAGGWVIFRVVGGASLVGAVTGPKVIVDERIELSEGNAQSYGFQLRQAVRVDVKVSASPKVINVLLMSEQQWERFRKVKGSLWGGEYQYSKALSRQRVLEWSGSEVLSPGNWRVVVERPSDSVLFGDSTKATVQVVVH